jgi:Anti-sigma-K factor rskA
MKIQPVRDTSVPRLLLMNLLRGRLSLTGIDFRPATGDLYGVGSDSAVYELWFAAPGDTRRRPDRVSAGTFHPDEAGRGTVRLLAAADPKRFPRLSVTLEPVDGNPRRTGPEVLRP